MIEGGKGKGPLSPAGLFLLRFYFVNIELPGVESSLLRIRFSPRFALCIAA
jgi:hypothetical protein